MKLSDAIALGYSEIGHDSFKWLQQSCDGGCEGCAIGAALYAVGERNVVPEANIIIETVRKHWPWAATQTFLGQISSKFHQVMNRPPSMTIEELIDWVRSVEPSEPLAVQPSSAATSQLAPAGGAR